jgi:hypothetical protein
MTANAARWEGFSDDELTTLLHALDDLAMHTKNLKAYARVDELRNELAAVVDANEGHEENFGDEAVSDAS